jgi:hypothetical protein
MNEATVKSEKCEIPNIGNIEREGARAKLSTIRNFRLSNIGKFVTKSS